MDIPRGHVDTHRRRAVGDGDPRWHGPFDHPKLCGLHQRRHGRLVDEADDDPAGAVVLAGRVDGRNAAGVPIEGALAYLDRTPRGSTVAVTTTTAAPAGAGATVTTTYRVVAKRQVTKTAFPRIAPSIFTTAGAPRLVLVTRGGPFDRQTGHYLDNDVLWTVPLPS